MFDTSVKFNIELRLEFRKNLKILDQDSYFLAIHFYRSSFFYLYRPKPSSNFQRFTKSDRNLTISLFWVNFKT